MKSFTKSIILLFFFNLISIHFLSGQQCGYTNEAPIVNYQVANRGYSTIGIRVQIHAIMNSDGSKGVSRSQAITTMEAVADDFLNNYDIKLNYCVRELRDDKVYNFESHLECLENLNSNIIQFRIHEDCTPTICGLAFVTGNLAAGWAVNRHSTIMHEFGHIFGLNHTHNNSHVRNSSCETNPSGCAETVHQRNCNNNSTVPKTCEIDGDGICDTPADPLCYTTTWCPPFVKDRCDVDYPTPIPQDLLKNFMSYYINSRTEFTSDQKNQMHGYILSQYSSNYIGEMSSCDNSTINSLDLGRFDSNQVFENQTIYFSNGISAKNCNLFFKNCTVHIAGDIQLDDAYIYFYDNTTFKAGALDYCTGAVSINWRGVKLFGSSALIGFNGSIIESLRPVIGGSNLSTLSFIWLDNVNVNGIQDLASKKGIESQNGGVFILNNSVINGSVNNFNNSISLDPHGWYLKSIHVQNSSIISSSSSPFASNFGINNFNSNTYFENSNLKGGGLRSFGSASTIVTHSTFKDILGDAMNCSNNDYFKLDDSHIYTSGINITNPVGYDITSNNFYSGSNISKNSILISNKDDISHSILRNILNNEIGIKTSGKQFGLKMLCNSFTSVFTDFWWENDVHPLQGFGLNIPSGNNFAQSNHPQIFGNSETLINYNFNTSATNEEPVYVNHTNLRKWGFPTSAGCGIIGASWTPPPGTPPACPPGINCSQPCPVGIDCTQPCPTGINCTQACPPGINCTQPCPPGINCTQACPPGINCLPTNPTGCPQGIDCTQPCPTGINCAQDCPPGIDCTQPCPAGIDCTQPCPLGIDCYVSCPQGIDCHTHCPPGIECDQPCTLPQGCHEPCISCLEPGDPVLLPKPCDDPLFTYLDNQYNQSEAQYIALRDTYMSLPQYGELSQLLNQQSLINKPRIIQLFTEEPRLVTPSTIKLILDNSLLYTEAEVVSLIKLNPALMLDSKIKPIISKSSTFTNSSINEILSNYNQNAQSQSIINLWAMDAKKTKMSGILHYGLYRIAYYDMKYCERYNQWLKKFNNISAELRIIDNLLNQNRIPEINVLYSQLLSNPQYSLLDKTDISQYQNLTNLLISVANGGRNLSQLSLAEQQQINGIALSPTRFSAIKAQDILTAFYNYNYPEFVDQDETPEKLYFLNSGNTINRAKIKYDINIAPNPTTGNITITHNVDAKLSMIIRNIDGKIISKIVINDISGQYNLDNLNPGIYLYTIYRDENIVLKKDRLVIIK